MGKGAENQELALISEQICGVPGRSFGEDFQAVLVGSESYRVMYNFDAVLIRFYQGLSGIKIDIKNSTPVASHFFENAICRNQENG